MTQFGFKLSYSKKEKSEVCSRPSGPSNGWGYGNSFCKSVPTVTHLLLSKMSSQAWIKAAAHSRDQSVTLCQSTKLTIICKNYSRFYKIIKHPNQVPSEIVYLVFYPRICRKLPNLQHIYTKKYMKRVIIWRELLDKPINIQRTNSLSPLWDVVLKHYSELLLRVKKVPIETSVPATAAVGCHQNPCYHLRSQMPVNLLPVSSFGIHLWVHIQ